MVTGDAAKASDNTASGRFSRAHKGRAMPVEERSVGANELNGQGAEFRSLFKQTAILGVGNRNK